jgi:hypothetical protein
MARARGFWSHNHRRPLGFTGGSVLEPGCGSGNFIVPALALRPGDDQRAAETVVVMPSDAQAGIMTQLGERADDIRGTVAVLIGSTEKMGVGTNVQLRAIALHHLDCPWRPADVAQREGRIIRQGNANTEVQILRYVTERSFDGYMWQTVERKARFIAQVMRGKLDVREIDDIGDAALSYNEVKALATGNPLLMEKAEADAELTRLERAERAWNRNLDALTHKVTTSNEQVRALEATAAQVDAAIARRRDTRGDAFTMTVGATRHTRRADAGEHLKTLIAEQDQALTRSGHKRLAVPLGELGGFPVLATTEHALGSAIVTLQLDGAPGTEIRMTPAEVAAADPGKLIVRMEGRLTGLEALRAKTLAEISRLTAEADHARDDLAKPFAQAGKLAAARERARQIDEQLSKAGKLAAARSRVASHGGARLGTRGAAQPRRPAVAGRGSDARRIKHGRDSRLSSCRDRSSGTGRVPRGGGQPGLPCGQLSPGSHVSLQPRQSPSGGADNAWPSASGLTPDPGTLPARARGPAEHAG